ncbi:AAA domain-containing protein [Actinacidiphila glaucinigra]|uniref:AAA domain-containing protein n=1 Tax=Actinacidiphila glaucinigra TaxID=235986 RepID=UPI00366AE386
MAGDTQIAQRMVTYFCCDEETARYGPYVPLDPDGEPACKALLDGRMYTCQLLEGDDVSARMINVDVYLGLSSLGGLLWDQEIRALSRLSGLDHPALPQLLAGGYQDTETVREAGADVDGVAFVATEGSDYTLAEEGPEPYRRAPLKALRQFEHLADGLAVLHDLRLAHRNLSPETIDVVPEYRAGPGETHLRLARFEMSAFVSSLLDAATVDSTAAPEDLRRLTLGGPEPLPYLPPERVRHLLPMEGEQSNRSESVQADVYGLAAIAWEWFVGSFPPELVPDRVPEDPAAVAETRGQLRRLGEHMRGALRTTDLPPALASVLRRMLDEDPAQRPTAAEVVNELSENHEDNVVALGQERSSRPLLVAFMPERCEETLGRWGWLENEAVSPEGVREIADLLTGELRGTQVLFSQEGADPYVGGGTRDAKREATTVLVGRRALWFGQLMRPVQGQALGTPLREVLLVKYVAQRDAPGMEARLDDLQSLSRSRRLPDVQVVDHRMPRARLTALRQGRPSWAAVIDAIRPVGGATTAQLDYQRAIDWLLEFQGVELQARRYPYELDPHAPGDNDVEVLVSWDRRRDQDRIFRQPLLTKYARHPDLRPDFGDFFGRLESEEGGSADVELYGGDSDRKDAGTRGVQAQVVRSEGQDRIILRRKHGEPGIPRRGWIRPADDVGSEAVLRRQLDARWELFGLRPLLSQIRNPRSIRTLPHRWARAGEGLLGGGRKAVQDILTHQQFFALQGPPGTGKTTVTSRAIAAYLEQHSTHRILVSAQSNFTLDNLAARILRDIGALDDDGPTDRLGDVPIALRMVSQRSSPDDTVRPWLRDELAVRRARQMGAHIDRSVAAGVDPWLRPILERWRKLLRESDGVSILPELADRLQRGANIVFATCATATPRNVGAADGASAFDWVVVEEAAKAWPTELAIPLVRGVRWTLIGDHYQLPAHRRDEVVRFLAACVGDPNTSLAEDGERSDAYLEAFDLFRNLFEPSKTPAGKAIERPTAMLSTQFRMRKPIADIISRVFYPRELRDNETPPADGLRPGGLATRHDEQPPPLRFPHWLRGRALVWVDTAGMARCAEQPHWRNEGEAEIVNAIVSAMEPRPEPRRDGYSAEPLAVLTPYRQQAERLRQYGDLAHRVQTIHAFQGREADIVIVSLVRNKVRGGGSTAESYGHLSRRDLINVMFSRARRLLVIVGDWEHYARYEAEDDFWRQVCQCVDTDGHIVNATDVLSLESR